MGQISSLSAAQQVFAHTGLGGRDYSSIIRLHGGGDRLWGFE